MWCIISHLNRVLVCPCLMVRVRDCTCSSSSRCITSNMAGSLVVKLTGKSYLYAMMSVKFRSWFVSRLLSRLSCWRFYSRVDEPNFQVYLRNYDSNCNQTATSFCQKAQIPFWVRRKLSMLNYNLILLSAELKSWWTHFQFNDCQSWCSWLLMNE